MINRAFRNRRRWFAPEVVQTSTMDCGPASLKCLLEGHGIPVSYGRLREACQTDVDGTSIDTIEIVANQMGLRVAQVMIPPEHVTLKSAPLPALVVVRHADGPTHFVVAWRRVGGWLQVMDPAVGRRWVSRERFDAEIVRHETSVSASQWREWAGTEPFLSPVRERMRRLRVDQKSVADLTARALADEGWFGLGALDASIRLVTVIVNAGGLAAGPAATRLLSALFRQTCENPHDIYAVISPAYWSVTPDPTPNNGEQQLVLRGAVLLQATGRVAQADVECGLGAPGRRLSPELAAALREAPTSALASLWGLLAADGALAPLALSVAVVLSSTLMIVEALLFRGLFDIGALLPIGRQRLAAAASLLAFMALAVTFRVPIIGESLRLGRRLDVRLRMALLRKLPRLTDRYFQSRPLSDLADRGHSIHSMRRVPGMAIHFVLSASDLVLTLVGIAVIAPASVLLACVIVLQSLAVPAIFQPLISERDLRVRNHAGALNRFYLDALLGLMPIRAHRAEAAVRHQHQSLLVEWARSSQRTVRASLCAGGLQAFLGMALACTVLMRHFVGATAVTGADLLLVYWTLKLPSLGSALVGLAHQYPMQRNVLLRLLEPLSAPERVAEPAQSATTASGARWLAAASTAADRRSLSIGAAGAVDVSIAGGMVVAAGHTILRDVNVQIDRGEHVAIVGLSGAGKSTLIGLLLGWHRLAEGRLVVDGVDVDEDALEVLRRRTAWLDPAVHIWNRTLFENLAYSSDRTQPERTAAAIGTARLRGVVRRLPQGLQTRLGEGGALLSGGEGQRVRLARVLAQADVALALLDEPFRGLDRDQRSLLLTDARAHWRAATMLCVTHDVSETLGFDRVLVIEGGRVLEDDTPTRLASGPSRYRALLDAERRVRERMWKGDVWRRIAVQEGAVGDAGGRRFDASLSAIRKG